MPTSSPDLAELLVLWPRLTPDAQASLLRIARARVPASATAASLSEQKVPAGKTILERVEDIIERERNRAKGVMNGSRGGDNLYGHRYDCGYWEGLLYTLAAINALVAAEEQSS